MYEYAIKRVKRIHDGDTIIVDLDLGRKVTIEDDPVRFFGLNCPEIHDANPDLKKRAEAAMAFVTARLMPTTGTVQVKMRAEKPYPDDKYGRWCGMILYRKTPTAKKAAANWEGLEGWTCLNDELLATGHAKPYTGQGIKPV